MSQKVVAGSIVLLLFGFATALPAADTADTADTAETGDSPAMQEYKDLYSQVTAALDKIAVMQAKITAASKPPDEATRKEYYALAENANALSPKLEAAALRAYAENPDKEIGDLLFTMAINHLRRDNYERALEIAQLLIKNDHPQKRVAYRVAASSATATMQIDEAKKLIESLEVPNEPGVQQLRQQVATYEPLWQQEQKIREAEAKADDLPRVKLQTSQGDIVLELFENEAPNTVANFISLVEKGYYDGTAFHRVLPGFMAQGGDPNTKNNSGPAGSGGPGYTIACECYEPNHRLHFRGSLSMAHAGRDTGGSQFFLTFAPAPHLDGKHTVFGRVIEGMDVLSKLRRIDPDKPGPDPPDKIIKTEVVRKRSHPYEPKTTAK